MSNHEADALPQGDFTAEERQLLRRIAQDYRHARWIKRVSFRVILAIGATGTALVALKDQILPLFSRGP
jgi:hypothetical protein